MTDSDETEGRKLYRAAADALANAQINYGSRAVRVKSPTVIILPMPPTTNNLFAGKTRRFRTPQYEAWIKEAGWRLASQRPAKWLGAVSVLIEVSERESTDSWDLANREKATMDLLVEHGVIQGDNRPYVRKFAMEWADIDGIRVTIENVP